VSDKDKPKKKGKGKKSEIGKALTDVADALNTLYSLGEQVDIKFGIFITDYAYLVYGNDDKWSVKMKVGEAPEWWDGTPPAIPDDE
jgi:hypothetical protein